MMFPMCGPMAMTPMGMVPMGMMGMGNMGMGNMGMGGMMGMANMMGGMMGGMGGMGGMGMGMAPLGMAMASMGMAALMASDADGEIGPNGELTEGKKYHGVVKTFDLESKACVFMVPGAKEDVFTPRLSVPKELEGQNLAGQPFAFEVARGPDGALHAQDCQWRGGVGG
eukprot:CAMPEP_0179101614 /NCGR_PEP_ID=MMETSP0796-20121207/46990_1 /TAXON_ID=73915 /ORGANISM="Pyrodinium bahamense, Strain pbaha01" /LENGTH=168 /DNA_ID=CAMNT_0020799469 /DNA_START=207 /DNA_END=709 /DNA_ORIENTATION=+